MDRLTRYINTPIEKSNNVQTIYIHIIVLNYVVNPK